METSIDSPEVHKEFFSTTPRLVGGAIRRRVTYVCQSGSVLRRHDLRLPFVHQIHLVASNEDNCPVLRSLLWIKHQRQQPQHL